MDFRTYASITAGITGGDGAERSLVRVHAVVRFIPPIDPHNRELSLLSRLIDKSLADFRNMSMIGSTTAAEDV